MAARALLPAAVLVVLQALQLAHAFTSPAQCEAWGMGQGTVTLSGKTH